MLKSKQSWEDERIGTHGQEHSYSPTAQEFEGIYRQYHSAILCRTDWQYGIVVMYFALKSLFQVLKGVPGVWPKLLTSLPYLASFVFGLGPIFYFPFRRRALYLSWREWFLVNSLFWALLRYRLYMGTFLSGEISTGSHGRFLTMAIGCGPHVPIILLGMGYPLRVQIAFCYSCVAGIGACACTFVVHTQLVASDTVRPHLVELASRICAPGMYYTEFVYFISGEPCDADNVLLNVWGAQSGLAVAFLLYFILFGESFRRRKFLKMTKLREPFPLFWNEWNSFSWTSWLGFPVVAGMLTLHVLMLAY